MIFYTSITRQKQKEQLCLRINLKLPSNSQVQFMRDSGVMSSNVASQI